MPLMATGQQRNQPIPNSTAKARSRFARADFQMLLEASPEGVVITDAKGLIRYSNRHTSLLFGYAQDELLDHPIEMLVPERFRTNHLAYREGYSRDPVLRPMGSGLTLYGRRKDGSEFPLEISLSPLRIKDVSYTISTVRDITQRLRLEATAREQEQRMQAAFSSLLTLAESLVQFPESTQHSWEGNGKQHLLEQLAQLLLQILATANVSLIVYAQETDTILASIMAGAPPEVEERWQAIWHERPRLHDHLEPHHFQALYAGEDLVEDLAYPHFRVRGSFPGADQPAPHLIRIVPMLLGTRLVGLLGIPATESITADAESRDLLHASARLAAMVVERERLLIEQQTLREAETRRKLLQAVVDELPSGVYLVHGPNAQLVLANRAAASIWGSEWREGQPMADFLATSRTTICHANGTACALDDLATMQTVRTGQAVHTRQEIMRRPDGTTLPIIVTAVAIDTTALGMTSAVAGEQGAIVVLQDVSRLKAAEQLKDDFISTASHELRNPMAALKGFANMLITQTKMGRGPDLAEWQWEAIVEIESASDRLVALTNDLVDVTNIQAARLTLHPAREDLVPLIHIIIGRMQMASASHSFVFQTSVDSAVLTLDVMRIEQVLLNLFSNAVKYSPGGGEVVVTLSREESTRQVTLQVRDSGIGIPADQQARIFQRFARASNVHDHHIQGTGLGLFLCRELIERHGGHIWFESVAEQGTTFFVELPMHEA